MKQIKPGDWVKYFIIGGHAKIGEVKHRILTDGVCTGLKLYDGSTIDVGDVTQARSYQEV